MKSKFFFVMSVAAAMLLASCGGNSSSSQSGASSQAGTTSQAETSQPSGSTSQATPRVVKVECTPSSNSIQVGKTLTLVPVVTVEGGASDICTFTSSDKAIATVSDGGVVTAVAPGEVTITIAAMADPTVKCEVRLTIIGEQFAKISELQDGQKYLVKGEVVALNTRSFIIHDGTGAIMVYLNAAPEFEIGDLVKVEGTVASGQYTAGLIQFDKNAKCEKVEGDKINLPVAVGLTKEIVEGWKAAYEAATSKTGQFFNTTDVKLYGWDTVATKSGDYDVTKVAGCDIPVEPVYADSAFAMEEGKKYHVEGYFAGFRQPSSGDGYAQYVITKRELIAEQPGDVSISTEDVDRKVTVGDSIEISASVYGMLDATVEWSLKEENASAVATITPKEGEPNKATLTGVAPGKVTVVASYNGKSAELVITVESAAVATTLNALQLNQVVILDVTVIALGYQGYVVADATSAAFVYDRTNTPTVGAHLSLTAKVGSRNGGIQLVPEAGGYVVAEGEGPAAPAATVMTEAVGLELIADLKVAKEGSTFADPTKVGLYTFENVLVGGSGNYLTWEVGNAHFETNNTADANKPEAGKNYNITGVVYGFYAGDVEYATVVVTSLEEVQAEEGDVSISGPSSVKVGEDINLVASVVGSEQPNVAFSLKDAAQSAFVTLTPADDGKTVKVTGVAEGEAVIVATCGEKSAEHKVTVVPNTVIESAKLNAVIKDQVNLFDVSVIALGYQGYVVADDTSAVFVYDKTNTPTVGAHLSLTAKAAARNGGIQLVPEADGYVVAEGEGPAAPAATVMTEAVGLELIADLKAAKEGSTFADPTKVGLYTFENVLVGGSGNYLTWEVGNAHFETNNTADANKPEAGKNYNITGVVYGFYAGDVEYATVVVTSLEEVQAEEGDVSISGPSSVKVGEDINLVASVVGSEQPNVAFSLKDAAQSAFVTLTPADDGKTVKVTGVAEGEAVIVATCGEKSAEHKVTVNAADPVIEEGKLNAVVKDQVNTFDVTVVAVAYRGYVVADDTSAVYVYDQTNTPAVGTHLSLTAKAAAYFGGVELVPEENGYVVAEGEGPVAPAATAMTEAAGAELIADLKAAKEGSTFADPTKVGLFSFENVLVGGSGNNLTWEVGNAHFKTSNTADANKPAAGKNYNITGVVFNYQAWNNVDTATVVITSVEEVVPEQLTWQLIHGSETVEYTAVDLEANPGNEHEYMASVHLEVGEEVFLMDDEYNGLGYINLKPDCRSLFDENGDGNPVVKAAGTYTFYIEDTFTGQCIWADYTADPATTDYILVHGSGETYDALDLTQNPTNEHEFMVSVHLAADEEVWFQDSDYNFLDYQNLKDDCKSLFNFNEDLIILAKAAGTYTFYVEDTFAGKCIWADYTADPAFTETTFTAGVQKGEQTSQGTYNDVVTQDNVTLTGVNTPLGNDDNYRIYKNRSIVIAVPEGYVITSIVLNCTANNTNKYGPGCLAAQEGYSYDGKVGTWVGSAQSVTFTAETEQVRCTSIVVTWELA